MILRTYQNEEGTSPFVSLIEPLVNRPPLNDHIARARLDALSIIQNECYGTLRHNRVVERDCAMELLDNARRKKYNSGKYEDSLLN